MTDGVLGTFTDRVQADAAVRQLTAEGISPANISVVVNPPHVDIATTHGNVVAEASLTGLMTGGIIGGLLAWIVTLGPYDVGGLGKFAADYPTGTTLLGIAIGAALGGLLAAVAAMSFKTQRRVDQGDILVTVRAVEAPVEPIRAVLEEHHAVNVQEVGDLPPAQPLPPASGTQVETLPLRVGQEVYTLDGVRLGTIRETRDSYFVVGSNPLSALRYVPNESVHQVNPSAVYVNAEKSDLTPGTWREPPPIPGA